jgi:formiminotetrahydrofolate cyclodeaminase
MSPADSSTELLKLETQDLLESFGAGKHKPGAGSAAALTGLLAVKLTQTVCKLTLPKVGYESVRPEMEFVLLNLEKHETVLADFLQKDMEAFHKVFQSRKDRDAEPDPVKKAALKKIADQMLIEATEIPLEICNSCLEVADFALEVFDKGYKSARGDSSTAVSCALSGANSTIAVIYLNLKYLGRTKYVAETKDRCEALNRRTIETHTRLFQKIGLLNSNVLVSSQLDLLVADEPLED